jgi:hypothetical protein
MQSLYKYIAIRADCNSAAVSANITVSSAYSNKYNLKYNFFKNDISETLHLEFCKYIMKVKKCTQNYIVYGELLGRVPMSIHINARMIGATIASNNCNNISIGIDNFLAFLNT